MSHSSLQVHPVSPAVGAVVSGVDVAAELDEAIVAAIRRVLLTHLVVFFRGQSLTPERLLAFARRFGELARYPLVEGMAGHPDIVEVVKEADETHNFGGIWHTDTTYLETPPLGSVLYAVELPPVGGDTLFANQYLAFETLSEGMQRLLRPLRSVNTNMKAAAAVGREDRRRDRPVGERQPELVAEHPVVRRHPETGREALFLSYGHTIRFAGMTEAESAPLLDYLFAHQVRPELCCRFRWEPGSVAFWDNRALLHNAVNDYHGHRRAMWRVTLK